MQRSFYPLLCLMLCIQAISVHAQVFKGFKLLEKKKPEKAEIAFIRASGKPSQQDAVEYGFYKLHTKELRDAKNFNALLPTYQKLSNALKGFNALPEKYAKRFKKKGIVARDFQTAIGNLQTLALKLAQKSDSVLVLDDFKAEMGQEMSSSLSHRYDIVEDSLTRSNYKFQDYATLRSIYLQHRKSTNRLRLATDRKFVYRILFAYCRDYPLQDFPGFCKDLPIHWSCNDCYWSEFKDSLQTHQLSSLLNFMYDHPRSNLDQVISYAFEQPVNADLVAQAEALDAKNRERWLETQQSSKWLRGDFPLGISDEELVKLIKNYLKTTAPSNRSYWVLTECLELLHEKHSWPLAAELTRYAQPLYPYLSDTACVPSFGILNKDSIWFATTVHAFTLPEENLAYKKLATSTKMDDYSPVIKLDASVLYFASETNGEETPTLDIYASEKADTSWTVPTRIPALSGKEDQLPLSLALHGNLMLLKSGHKLCLSARNGNDKAWSNPSPVSSAINSFSWIGRGTLSENGQVLIYEAALDSFPLLTESNIDLYIAIFNPKTKTWSEPSLLNSIVNTPWQERAPFLHIDGESLYFTSYGNFGLEEQDLMVTTRLDSTWHNWSVPKPLGKQINGFSDDFTQGLSISSNGVQAYTSLNTTGLSRDLFMQELPSYDRPRRVKIIKGQIEKYQKSPWVKLVDAQTERVIDSTRSDANGEFLLLSIAGKSKQAIIYADDPDIYSTYVELDLDSIPDVGRLAENPITIGISEMVAQDIPIPLRYVQFGEQSDGVSARTQKELNWMTRFFLRRRMSFLLAGYADKKKPDPKSLSMRRAKNIKSYLSTKGLIDDRIWLQDFGEERPAMSAKNRVKIVENRHVEVYLKN